MSTPSSRNDEQTGGDEYFRHGINHDLTSQHMQQQQHTFANSVVLQQQQQPLPAANVPLSAQHQQSQPAVAGSAEAATPQFVQWTNPLMGGAPFLQQQAQPAPPQQQFNDFLFNIQAQAAYAAAATTVQPTQGPPMSNQQETYSVLRVGNGNFLKIYHCPENAMGPMPGETSFTPMPQYSQSQPTAFQHINHQTAGTQSAPQQQQPPQPPISATPNTGTTQVFNSYELFSSNTFTQLPSAEMPPILLLGPNTKTMTSKTEQMNTEPQTNIEKNILIQSLPNNWSGGGNTSAPLYAQFENVKQHHDIETLTQTHPINTDGMSLPLNNDITLNDASIEETINAHIAIQQQQQQNPSMKLHINEANIIHTSSSLSSSTSLTAPPTTLSKTEIPRHQESVPRKRIVAEVKPMRMTYSDVLSKFNNQMQNSQEQQQNQNKLINSTTTTNQRNQQKSSKSDTQNGNNSSNSLNSLSQRRIIEEQQQVRTAKKSPTHDNKENQQQQQHIINNKLNNNPKRSSVSAISNNNSTNTLNGNNSSSTSNKPSATTSTSQKNLTNNSKATSNNGYENPQQQQKKLRLNKNSDIQNIGSKNNNEQQRGSSKNNGNNTSNSSTLSSNAYNSTNNTYARKPTKSLNSGNATYSATSSTSSATNPQRSRYQNNSNASYSYLSTKRGRNNSSYGISSSLNSAAYVNRPGSNRNYELAKRFLQAWFTYTIMILTWLFYLVYDIVVLGCSILYERLTYAYDLSKTYLKQLHRDLKQNSNKPGIWFKNSCRKFDAKFCKTSKWAFWRRFFKKKPPESSGEAIKTGRLPATGDEAMYQLLNCKGKDAYSILGVPPNSSQEQIRKHYKKIAVLVHPDKNKQPGAEEAFKVLQRAFELIGEPENRLAYDQSLAEALHAEKAWTELHDLLSQLQTKITEAANTIRCSTCGLRHPRKITDRPYYAARECASCKIRHSAREGDIWAETSMLGLRWKYLALMEGKVYDITEWANCQKGALAHLEPNSHMVQYRIVRGAQQQQQQQKQQQHAHQHHQQQQQQQQHQQHTGSQYPSSGVGGTFNRDNIPPSEASLHEFLDNLYSRQHPQQQQQNSSAYAGSSRRRNRRN